MRSETATALLVLVCAATSTAAAASRSGWSHVAPVEVRAVLPGTGVGLVEFELTPEVLDLARVDLADLRVSGPDGRDVPYVRRTTRGTLTDRILHAKLYNRTSVPGERSTVTADFGSRLRKSCIKILTAGTDFRRSVVVEASEDGERYQVLRDGALLFRVASGAAGKGYERATVNLPENDFRYLRVTVTHAPDDPEQVNVSGVVAWQSTGQRPETRPVPLAVTGVRERQKGRLTEVLLDLDYRNLPLHSLALAFSDRNFHRRITVAGRNAEKRVVKLAREDAPPLEREVEEPWVSVTSGVVYRFAGSSGQRGEPDLAAGGSVEESLAVQLSGAGHRYLRVRIENRDDEPLEFLDASATRLVNYVAFQPRDGGDYALYLGKPRVAAPDYDLSRFAGKLRAEGVETVRLGPVVPNPEFGAPEKVLPWSERHGWVLWVALLAVAATLGLLVFRQMKSIVPEGKEDSAG